MAGPPMQAFIPKMASLLFLSPPKPSVRSNERDTGVESLKRHGQGTSNIGVIQGGEATNQVTDHVFIRGESRSHSMEFMEEITTVCLTAFENAAKKVKNDIGQTGHIKFISNQDYEPFALSENEAVVQFAYDTAQQMGLVPSLENRKWRPRRQCVNTARPAHRYHWSGPTQCTYVG